METRDPGALRTIRLLAGMSLRRWINRKGARFRRRENPRPGEPRLATARKERGGGAWLFLVGLMFLLSSLNISLQFLMRLSQGLQGAAGGELVHRSLFGHEIDVPWGGALVQSAGTVLTLLACCQLWLSLGTSNQDLGRLEWSLEWLFTFPVPAGRLFLAKVCEYAIVNPLGWFMIFPFLVTAFWMGGHAAWSIPEAVGVTLGLGFVAGSLRLTVETWLRMNLSIDRLKNVQAGCTLVGTVLWLGVLWVAMAQPVPAFFVQLVPRVPPGALWNPLSVGILLVDPDQGRLGPAGTLLAYAVLFPLASSAVCRFLVREGLLTSSGTFQGSRQRIPSGTERRPVFRGILAKDLRLLFRDRNFLVGTLVVPVLVFAFQAVLYPNLLSGVTGDFRHAATLAYGLGAYILMSSAFHVLTIEGQSLWLLYTFPRELHRILIEKTAVWAAVALLYAGIALGVTASFSRGLDWGALSLAVTALVGVVLAAFTAAALGTLAVDPLQQDFQRKIRAEVVYLYMLLSGMFGYALYGPSAWLRLVQVILSTLLVWALWLKVRDRLPYLLDPTEMPPPRIALSDGLIAVLAFFILQGLIGAATYRSSAPYGPWVIVSYAGAGGAVVLLSLYIFWRLRVPRLLEAVGLRSSQGSVGRALILGPMAGLSAAVAGVGYLIVIQKLTILKPFIDEQVKASDHLRQDGIGWLALLAVVAAPLFEEYLFRGLVFKGMRRFMKPAASVLASAAIFAIIHPPLSWVPVFGLGVGAAMAFEGSGLLLAPILAHVVYNGSMVLLTRPLPPVMDH